MDPIDLAIDLTDLLRERAALMDKITKAQTDPVTVKVGGKQADLTPEAVDFIRAEVVEALTADRDAAHALCVAKLADIDAALKA